MREIFILFASICLQIRIIYVPLLSRSATQQTAKTSNTMTRFNRSEITRNAWSLFRTSAKSFSDAMKQAWAKAKGLVLTAMEGMKELAAELACKINGKSFNHKVYGGVNQPLHIFVRGEQVLVDETFAVTFEKAYQASMSDEGFDALLDGDETTQYAYVLSQL